MMWDKDLVVFFSSGFYTSSLFSLEGVSTSGWVYLFSLLFFFKTFLALEPSFCLTDFIYIHMYTHTHLFLCLYIKHHELIPKLPILIQLHRVLPNLPLFRVRTLPLSIHIITHFLNSTMRRRQIENCCTQPLR